MLFFTSARAPAPRRSRDAADWIAAAQTIDPAAVMGQAKADLTDLARQLRASTPAIADELASRPRAVRRSLLRVVPGPRRRRRRWPMLVLGAVVLALAASLVARRLTGRRRVEFEEAPSWRPAPMPSSSLGEASVHPPEGLPSDVSTSPATLDRDAAIRAADEGMRAPDEMPDGTTGGGVGGGAAGDDAGWITGREPGTFPDVTGGAP